MNSKSHVKHYHAKPILEELETRQLFSGGVEGLLTEQVMDPNATYTNVTPPAETQQPVAQTSGSENTRNEIVFVDTRVENYQLLLNDIKSSDVSNRNLEIITLDSNQDGIKQISDIMAQRDNLDAVHIISHGSDGSLDLGNSQLNFDTLIRNQTDISAWGNSFNQNGDILLYGCNVAETQFGQSFVDYLAGITDTDIAASENATGNSLAGGDWELEYQSGSVEAEEVLTAEAQTQWNDVLAVTANSTSSAQTSNLGASGNKLTWSHTVNDGVNRALFVETVVSTTGTQVQSVTFGGVALTKIGSSSTNHPIEIWVLVNPTVSTADIVVTFQASGAAAAGATTYNGVNQSSAHSGFTKADGIGTTATVDVSSANGDLVMDVQYWANTSANLVGTSQTSQWSQTISGTMKTGSTTEAGASTVTMTGTSGVSSTWEIAAVNIKAAANTAPVLTSSTGTLSYPENTGPYLISSTATITDTDSANFDGGQLTIQITANGLAEDRLTIRNQGTGAGQVGVSGTNISYGGVIVGSFNGPVTAGTALVVTFNASSSASIAQAVLRNLTYENISEDPSTTTRTITAKITDGDGGTSNTVTSYIAPTKVNDAPVANNDSVSANEDTIISGNVLTNDTDADNNPLTVKLVSGPTNATAFALNADGSFSYTPTANWSGADSFSYLVNDGSSSILHYWALEGNAVDTVGGANGSLMNSPTTITGVSGNALQFDGSDYVALPDVTYPSNFTLSFYFKVSDNSGTGIQYLYSHGAPGSTNAVQVAIIESSYAETTRRNHLVTSFIDANDDPFSGQLFTDVSGLMGDGQWHLYTATVTAGVGTKVYVDGALRASNATGGNGINPTGTAVIGGRSDLAADRFLNANGGMDSVTLYNRALSDTEVSGLLTNSPQATATITVNPVNDAPTDLYSINGVAESSLLGVYGFNNPSNLGRDDAGNNAPITFYGTPSQTTGPNGSGALDLAGGASGQYGDIVGITTGGAMTFAASVKFDSTGDWQRVFDFGQAYSGGIGNVYVGREGNTNNLTFSIEKGGVYVYRATAVNAITNGSWLHFAATVDASGNMSLYVNGNLAASTTGVALETGVRSNNFIGKSHWAGDAAFDGAIDNFVVANGVMSATDVAALYQQTSGFRVAENTANGTVIGTLVGFDVDASANPTYSLTDSAGGRFAINSTNGTLTVADGSLLNYEAATSHSITAQITDSLGNTYTKTLSVALTNLVDQPLQTIPLSIQEVNEDNALVFNTAGGNAISINDIFRTNLPLQVNLQVNHGTLTLSQTTGLSILGGSNGSAFMTILGTEAAINAALQGLTYAPNADYQGADSLTITTSLVASLEGHYTFENGNVLDQSVGASQNGALVGNARIVNDPARGEVLSLDGNRDYVEITGQFGNPTNVTLAAWVKSAAYNTDEVISLGDNIALRIGSGGQLTYFYYDVTGLKLVNTSTYLNSDWNHVALTFDDSANTINVYLNGTLVDSRAAPNSILYARGSNTLIGAHGFGETGFDFNGLIDDTRVYNRALAADEIAALAANQTTVTGSVAIQVNPVDDAPTFSSLNGNPTYVENGPAVLLDIDVTISDTELDALNGGLGNYAGASLTLLRNGGANGEDLLGFVDGNGITRSGGNLIKNGQVLATFDTTTTAGQLLVTFTAANGEIPTSADVDNILRQISYANSSDAPPASIQMNWTFNDGNTGTQGSGGALTTAGSITVSITTANDAPVFSQLNNSVNYSEGSYGVVLDADVTIFDAELSGINNFSGATLTLARHGGADSDDALAFDGTIVTVSGANVYVSGVLIGSYTFTGGEMNITFAANATQARVNSLMQNTVYWNWSDNPPASVQIDWTFSDANSTAQGAGGALTATGITTVNITGVNDAPSGTNKTLTIDEDSTYTLTAADFGFSDTDGNSFARVWITGLPAQGELLFNGATFAANNWVVKNDLDLGLLTFKPVANANGSSYASFEFQVEDDGGTANGGLDRDPSSNTITFNVNAVNDAPVLSGIETTTLAYSENDPAKAVSSTLVLTDVDNTTINSATVQLSTGYIPLEGRLTFTDTSNINGTWDSSTGTMTLTGVASLAEYQAALRSVAYENFSEQSTEGYLTVLIKVNNDLASNTVARDIYITTINDAPVLNSASLNVSEGQTVTVSATNFSVTDQDNLGFTYSVSNVSGGYFQLNSNPGISVTSFSSAQLTASEVQFVDDGNEVAPSFSATVSDGLLSSNTLAATINYSGINDAPVLTPYAPVYNLTEDSASFSVTVATLLGTSASDVDAAAIGLAITAISGDGGSIDYSLDGGVSWFSVGTVSETSALLLGSTDLLRFTPNGQNGGTVITTHRASDQSAGVVGSKVDTSANGGSTAYSAASDSVTVNIASINDAPVNTLPANNYTAVNTSTTFSSANGNALQIADVDAASSSVQLTLSISHGTLTLANTTGLTLVSGANASVSMTYSGTVAALNTALNNGLTFTPDSNFRGLAQLTMTTSDQGNTGTGGALTDTDTLDVHVGAIVVTNTSDTISASANTSSISALIASDGGDGISLREAIAAANNTAGTDYIYFSISGTSVHTINLSSPLTITSAVVLDASSDDNFSANSSRPAIVLNGGGTAQYGIQLYAGSDGSTIRGLVIQNFTSNGIDIANSNGNTIAGNWIGLNAAGTGAAANTAGVNIWNSANNIIGGSTAADRNVISGNTGVGIALNTDNGSTTGNQIKGNYIGTDVTGANAVGNANQGIWVNAAGNSIGGTAAGEGNVISGTINWVGIQLEAPASNTLVAGNLIGLDAVGTAAIANAGGGIYVQSANNTIGGTTAAARNVISGNNGSGITLTGSSATGNVISGNYIGTDISGTVDLGNANSGITIESSGNTIGGTASGAGNLISGNSYSGVFINGESADNNVIQGNYIGTDISGNAGLANSWDGISVIGGADNTTIGGGTAAARNIIAGNTEAGVYISDNGTTGTTVQGNYIGVGADGVTALGNGWQGVAIENSATSSLIGGTLSGAGNIIANNDVGITVVGGSSSNVFLQNSIYSNTRLGIDLSDDGATANDTGDVDTGPNSLLNTMVLTRATVNGTNLTLSGTYSGAANSYYRIEVFSDATASGEGRTYLNAVNMAVGSSGTVNIQFNFSDARLATGQYLTVTATRSDSSYSTFYETSEFSNAVITETPDSAPVGQDRTITVTEDTAYTFSTADFPFTDVDGNNLSQVWIESLPGSGTLYLNGVAVQAFDAISAADIQSGKLTYTPAANANGSAVSNFSFSIVDDGSSYGGGQTLDSTPNTLTINIAAVNDAPVFTNLNGAPTFIENGSAVVLDADVSLFDTELSGADNFNGSTLTLARHGGANAEDALAFDGTTVTVSGADVYVSGVQVGTYTFTGGQMEITFGANATNARVNSLMRNTVYWNWSETPPASVQIDWTFSDVNAGGQGGGGALTASGTTTVTITGVNDAPIAAPDTATAVEAGGSANGTLGTHPTGNVLINDSDPDVGDTRSVTGVAAGAVSSTLGSVAAPVLGSYGSITIAADGTYVYTLDNSLPAVQALRTSAQTLTDTFSYTVRDAGGQSSTTQLTITVQGANDRPFGLATSGLTVAEGTNINTVIGSVAGQDVDSGETFTYSMQDTAGGRFYIHSGTGAVYLGSASLINYEAAASHQVLVRATDAAGTFYEKWVTINITNVNEAPRIVGPDAALGLSFNGSFESGTTGWTLSGAAQVTNSLDWGAAPSDGSFYLLLGTGNQTGGVAETLLTTVVGETYTVSFDYNANANPGTQSLRIQALGGASLLDQTVNASAGWVPNYTQHSFSFVADSTSTTLRFSDVSASGSNRDGNLDNIRVFSAYRIEEDVADNAPVGQVVATDPDIGGSLTYSLTSDAGGRFAIDASTGAITVADSSLLDYETSSSHTVTVRVTDPGGLFRDQQFHIRLADINDAPTGTDATLVTMEDTPRVLTAADFGFADTDGNALTQVRITSLPGVGALRLNGVDVLAGDFVTTAQLSAGLLEWVPQADAAGSGIASFTFQVQDDGGTANGGISLDPTPNTVTFDVTAVNDAPTATNLSSSETYTEDTALNLTDIVISDVDSASVTATLTLSNTAAGALSTATAGTVTSTYNASTGVWSASGVLADVNAILAGLTFTPSADFNSSFTIATRLSDGTATINGTKAMAGTAANDAPLTTVTGTTLAYTENDAATAIDSGLTVSDVDNLNLSSATVTISAGFASGQDLLAFTNQNGVVGSWNSDTGVLTLTGNATVANYQAALRSITFVNTSENPSTATRTISFAVNDGSTNSNTGTRNISVAEVNDAPTAMITPASYSATEQTSLTLHGTGLIIADVDAGSTSVQATVSVTSGTLTASAGSTGVTVSGSGSSSIILSGTIGQINDLLAGNASGSLNYIINSDTPPATDTLTLSVNDQGNTGFGGALTGFDVATINIAAVNDAPVNTVYGDGTIVPEESVMQMLGSVVISDADSGSGTVTTTLSVNAAAGVFSATSASGVTISGSGTNSLVLSGDVASINAYFASVATAPIFTATADYNGSVSFTVVTTDNGSSGTGGALSDSDTISGLISAVADITNDSVTTDEDTPVTFDPLANDTFENAGRYISAIDGTSVSGGQTVAITGGNVTLNANGTLTFAPTANSNGATSFSYSVTSGGTTETATVAVTVNPINDAPVLNSASLSLSEGQTVSLTAANFGVTDPDNSSFSYTVSSVSGGYFQVSTAVGTPVTNFTSAQLAANQVQFVDDGNEVAPSFSVTVSDGALASNTLAATVNYTAVNDAPHVTWAGNYPFGTDEDTASAGITVNTLIMNGPVGSVGYSDADGSSLRGMAVITKAGSGSWEYSTDGVSWNDFGTVSNTHALLLEGNTQVRYVPDGSGAEAAQLQIRGWDQTTDTASSNLAASYGNASINDFSHAYSYEIATVTCAVSSTNDAPTLANPIADQNATEDSAFSFQVPTTSFADIDAGDSLSYTATLADGSALPSWLAFNTVNRTFSGAPLNADVGSISVRVTVTDSSNASVFDDFTITVANTNDAPTVANPIADQNATEDTAFSFQIPTNTFADIDVGDALSYTATLADGSALPNWLTFNAATQTFSGTPTNADVGSISVRVTASDGNGVMVYDDFALSVANVNDAPVLNLTDSAFTFVENASHVRIGSSATLADVDSSDFAGGTLTATISGNGTAEDRLFLVTQGTGAGQVQVVGSDVFIDGNLVATTAGGVGAGNPLILSFTANADATAVQAVANRVSFRNVSDNPSGLQRTVEMVVTDGDGGTSNTDSVLINVTPVNDAPVITGASLTLNEGQTVTVTGANFSITDPDNSSFTYTVSSVSGGYFQLSTATGSPITSFTSTQLAANEVQFVDDGNEVAPTFSVTVNDGALGSNTLAATINYTAVNDNAPLIGSGSSASVVENSTIGTVVYTASGSDADGNNLAWSLSGTDAALLNIDINSGAVTLKAPADYESKSSYSFDVVASDGTFSSSQVVTLVVTNLNDNAVSSVSDSDATTNTVAENAVNGTVLGILALANDADAGAYISYSLSDDAGGRFAIDSVTGAVTVADGSLLDYETVSSHSITVLATSSDGSSNSQSFTINLNNLNDNAVTLLSDSNNGESNNVYENATTGTVVGVTAFATDADAGATISYSLINDAGGRFAIDSTTGVVTVADVSLLDYETASSHNITVLATSSDGSSNSQSFTINVNNLNDSVPVLGGLTLTILEGQTTTLSAASFDVSDPDSGSFTYSLSDVTGGYFQLSTLIGSPIMSFSSSELAANLVQFVDNGDKSAPSFKVVVSDGELSSNILVSQVNYVPSNDTTSALQDIIAFNQTNGLNDNNQADNTHENSAPKHPTLTDQLEVIIDLNTYIDKLTGEASKENISGEGGFILEPGVWVNDGSNTKLSGLLDNKNHAERGSENTRKYHVQTTIPDIEPYTVDSETGLNEQEEMEFWNRLETIRKQMSAPEVVAEAAPVNIKVILGTSAGLTAGFVSWILRAGSLMASFMSTVPLLRRFDPLPIMRSAKKSAPVKNEASSKLDSESTDSEHTK